MYTSSSSCHAALQERMAALEAQVKQMGLQATQDCERLARDRSLTLQLLQKVGPSCWNATCGPPRITLTHPGCVSQEQERLCVLEKKYHALTGGRSLLKSSGGGAVEVSSAGRTSSSGPVWHSLTLDELFEQGFLHISEPDLVYADGPPHSPCPSSASFSSSSSSSLLPSSELFPVRLQEVTTKDPSSHFTSLKVQCVIFGDFIEETATPSGDILFCSFGELWWTTIALALKFRYLVDLLLCWFIWRHKLSP